MSLDIVLLTVLHLLVFAYWLGGDLGAFYASTVLTDAQRSVEARAAAAEIVNAVDLAPRIGLIFAAPTGLALAVAKGWTPDIDWVWVWAALLGACLWMGAAVLAHMRSGPAAKPWAQADRVVRYGVLLALIGTGVGIIAGVVTAPRFIAFKLLLLATTVGLGLGVRAVLAPFGPAFARMLTEGASDETDAAIAGALARARPLVVLIWICLVTAAVLGVATPM